MLDKLIEFLSNPLYNLLLASIIGIVSNLLTGKYFDRTKRLWWGSTTSWLNSSYFNQTGKLRLHYKGLDNKNQRIAEPLSVMRFVFWSNGKDTLRDEDISTRDPLIIYLPNSEILEIRPVESSNPTIRLEPNGKDSILVLFEHLERNQGGVFDVIFTGYEDTARLVGTIKGGKIATKELKISAFMALPFFPRKWRFHTRITASKWLSSLFFIFSLWATFVIIQSALEKPNANDGLLVIIQIASAVLAWAVISLPFWITPIIPKSLDEFYEEIT